WPARPSRHRSSGAPGRGSGADGRQRIGKVDPGPIVAPPASLSAWGGTPLGASGEPLSSLVPDRLRATTLGTRAARSQGQRGGRLRSIGPPKTVRPAPSRRSDRGIAGAGGVRLGLTRAGRQYDTVRATRR